MCGASRVRRPAGPGKCRRPSRAGPRKKPRCAARLPGRVAGHAQQISVNQAFIFRPASSCQSPAARFRVVAESPAAGSPAASGPIFRSLPLLIFSLRRAFRTHSLQNSISPEVFSGLPPGRWSFGLLAPDGQFPGTGPSSLFFGGNPLCGRTGRPRGSLAFFFFCLTPSHSGRFSPNAPVACRSKGLNPISRRLRC